MFLQALQLLQFKNHEKSEFKFIPGVNALAGDNGSGKTNVLDAIYYLATTKSYFNASDTAAITHGRDFFSLIADIKDEEVTDRVICSVQQGEGKTVKRNGKAYPRLSDYIGYLSAVIITPADIFILLEGSAERRKFFDSIISQANRDYLKQLIKYNRILEQRNRHLVWAAEGGSLDLTVMATLDEQLIPLAHAIHDAREKFTGALLPLFSSNYNSLAGGNEKPGLRYTSPLNNETMAGVLKQNSERDRILQRTSSGIHKDDWEFTLNDHPVKQYASQGQIKSFLIALKLAQYDYLLNEKGTRPLLLLDDIFEKIDAARSQSLMNMITEGRFGQIFITDTHLDRLRATLSGQPVPVKYFTLQQGKVSEAAP